MHAALESHPRIVTGLTALACADAITSVNMTRTSDSRVGLALWPVAVSLIVYLQRPRWVRNQAYRQVATTGSG